MLSLVSKTISLAWKYIGGENNDYIEIPDSDHSDTDVDDKEDTIRKEIHGAVTNVNDSDRFGLINGDVYFSFDVVNDSKRPSLGDKVIAIVQRAQERDPWKAIQVIPVEGFWNDGEEICSDRDTNFKNPESKIGVVASVTTDILILEEGSVISLRGVNCGEFKPQVGDVIQFSLQTKKLLPSRTREVSGQVTRIKPDGAGLINNEVWFDSSACINNFKPRRGSNVVASAVESHREMCMWRATSVVPVELPRTPTNRLWLNNKSPVQKNFLQCLLSDKNEITITSPLDFGVMTQGVKGYITVYINNNGDKEEILTQCRIQRKDSLFTLSYIEPLQSKSFDQNQSSNGSFTLLPGKTAYLNVFCDATQIGQHKDMLVFDFKGFEIGRYVTVDIRHPLQDSLASKNNYYRKELNRNSKTEAYDQQGDRILPGEKPFRTRHYLPVSLPIFPIPERLRCAVLEKGDVVSVAPSLAQTLSMECYYDRFSSLLHMEEIQMQLDMHKFDMLDVCLSPLGSEYLSLSVPGLAEGRPSLLIGDKVYLRNPDGTIGPIYQGYIHEVLMNHVLIKFHASFHTSYTGESYNVRFEFGRTGMRRCQQAVKQASTLVLPEVLFPNKVKIQTPTYQGKISFFNKLLNTRQKSAVKRILEHQCRPLPYIIFGPPGTGKTITLVEGVLQVFTCIKSSRIIVCTPTNSAADLVTIRLHQSGLLSVSDMARLNAFQRKQDSIPECIQQYCFYGDENLGQLIYHRVIVSTLGNVGVVYGLKVATGHFTHLFLDEAGQAMEPESLVAMELVTSAGENGQVILAGDPQQLGPVLMSSYSRFYGLQHSFLERLMLRQLYCRDSGKFADHGNYDPLLVTKLVENYRSHPALLKVYSDIFYQSELVPSAKNLLPVLWSQLNNASFPLLFHGIKGEDIQESDSPSWFNPAEVVQIAMYLQELYEIKIRPDEIGIITPYRKQVEKVRLLCGTLGLETCKIGSVEEFQGQERRVIILSLVRCSGNDNSHLDYSHLGFIGQPKRFNVAISRAQCLLVVLGDPDLLMQDEHWKNFIKYSVENNAYVGCPIHEI